MECSYINDVRAIVADTYLAYTCDIDGAEAFRRFVSKKKPLLDVRRDPKFSAFTDEELKVSSPSGFRGLAVLCPDKMDLIKNAIHRVYGGPSFEFCWSK